MRAPNSTQPAPTLEQLKAALREERALSAERLEQIKRLRFDLEMRKNGYAHAEQQYTKLRRMFLELRAHYDRLRAQAQNALRTLQASKELRATLQSRVQALESELIASKALIEGTQATAAQERTLLRKALQERDQALRDLTALKRRLEENVKRQAHGQAENERMRHSLENEQREKHMLLGCLRSAEDKLAGKDEQIERLKQEQEAMRKWADAKESKESKESSPGVLTAEEAARLCDRYFIAYPAERSSPPFG